MGLTEVIGKGQLAQAFFHQDDENTCVFASGVANSQETKDSAFLREENLLIKSLKKSNQKKFVYFSSCALSSKTYEKNAYYKHKEKMENIIKQHSHNYYIFRVPQLFSDIKDHPTLINFLYTSIKNGQHFIIYRNAYRYVIDLNDVYRFVIHFLEKQPSCVTVDLANPYRYSIYEIVQVLEKLIGKSALYTIEEKTDGYMLELKYFNKFIKEYHLEFNCGKDYLEEKLKRRLN